MAIARSATTSNQARQMLRDALDASVRAHTGKPDRDQARLIALAGAHLFGLAVARHIIQAPAIAQLSHQELVAEVAPTIQRYLTGNHL